MKLRLDLGELITQLRDLADTLETTQKPKTDPQGLPPEYDGQTFAPDARQEQWRVMPLVCTSHASCVHSMSSPLHDLERLAAGKLAAERGQGLVGELSGQPEPSHFTDGTKPARNPHTLDLPDCLDPAEAQHMLEVIADAQSGRTDPVLFAAKPRNLLFISKLFIPKPRNLAETLAGENVDASRDLDPQPLICPQCEHPYHRHNICPTCGCDH